MLRVGMLMGDSNGVRGRGGCTGMVALANGVDIVSCASVESPAISSEVARRSWDMLSGRWAHISADCS